MKYDYIVVGAGSAGSVLANRLSSDPSVSVLLIEAGGRGLNPTLFVPKGFYYAPGKFYKEYETAPFGPRGQTEKWARGRVLGGSSVINGLHWNRGWAEDYDDIERLGNLGWGWDTILPIFRQLEDHSMGGSAARGMGGPLGVSVPRRTDVANELLIEAGASMGWKRVADVNGSDAERIGYAPSSTKKGIRSSAARAFLSPIRSRKNLTIMIHTELCGLVFEGTRVVGVKVSRSGASMQEVRANDEVILSMGSFETPLTLERAGIGRGEVLRSAGIEQRVESPKVGEGLREHRAVPLQARLKRDLGHNRKINSAFGRALTGARYLVEREGMVAGPAYDIASYFKSRPDKDRPDVQAFMSGMSVQQQSAEETQHSKLLPERQPGVMFLTYALRPTSLGSVHVTSADRSDAPVVDPNYLATEHDREVTIDAFLTLRKLLEQDPISEVLDFETVPGTSVNSREEILENIVVGGSTGYHSLGTCAMGPEDDAVVDSDLRVRGVQGLRVIDASVFPNMPSGNCNAPTMAVAWHAADRILADR